MIERHVTFRLIPGKAEAFETFFGTSYAPAMAAQAGFGGAELLRPVEPDDTLLMVLRFSNTDAAKAWRESPAHKELSSILKSLYRASDVRVFEVLAVRTGD